jgi:cyclopropane-fatty-acyl-phospholipid synthase
MSPPKSEKRGKPVNDDSNNDASALTRLARTLLLSQHHLPEIGTGWGGLAIHAARHYGCRVTTTTISREQYELAKERVARAGLADRITLLLEDYRDLRGEFDALVSIEMIEAVGHQYLDTYFRQCSALLRPQGAMLLQAITIRDQFYDQAARTLRLWRERLLARQAEVLALGYPQSFLRMWEYYLCYCEGGFEERQLGDVQMLLTKPRSRRTAISTVHASPA